MDQAAIASCVSGHQELLEKLSDYYETENGNVKTLENVLKGSFHVKQLSADSTSPRMKYNFNSSPNLRPKSITTTRSTPGTPEGTPKSRRRKPPPPPLLTSIRKDDDDELEIKTLSLRTVGSSPNLTTASHAIASESSEPTPVPKPRRKRINAALKSNHLLKTASLDTNKTNSLPSTDSHPTPDKDNTPLAKPQRRAPPSPPKNPTRTDGGLATIGGGMRTISQTSKTSKAAEDVQPFKPSSEPIPGERLALSRGSRSDQHRDGGDQKVADYHHPIRPPGLLFTPPPSRSQSLRKYTSNRRGDLFSSEISKPKVTAVPPALSKPLPLLPSLSKPLPPLPISDQSQPPTDDSDYAYIPDPPENSSGQSRPQLGRQNDKQEQQQLLVNADHKPHEVDEELHMEQYDGGYVSMSSDKLRNSSQIGYSENEYMSMSRESEYMNAPAEDTISTDVFNEEDVEYISMLPASQQVNNQLTIDKNSTSVSENPSKIEDEYIKMSSNIGETSSSSEKSSTLPTLTKYRSEQTVATFGYNSMYIDLDMVRASLVANSSQHDNEAKHPKSRFSISSSETSPKNTGEQHRQHGKVMEANWLSPPGHQMQAITGSKSVAMPEMNNRSLGIYARISDEH